MHETGSPDVYGHYPDNTIMCECLLSLGGEITFPALTPDRSTINKNIVESTSGGHLHTLGFGTNNLDN